MRRLFLFVATLLALTGISRAEAPRLLWVYATVNFQVDQSVDDLIALGERAKAAGYTGMMITDHKFGRFAGRPQRYYANLARFRQAAERIGLDIAAAYMPIGYSNALLMNDPNLAEGIAVHDALFVVRGDRAMIQDEQLLPGGGLDTAANNRPQGWNWADGFGKTAVLDTQIKRAGAASLRMSDFRQGNDHGNARLNTRLKLKPWTQYHASVWIRTENVAQADGMRIVVLAEDGRSLNHTNLGVKPTQEWTQHHIVFNSMQYDQVNFYIGLWAGREGTFWIDEASVKAVGGVNLLRRDGCPIQVTSEDGQTHYTEGVDFAPWSDPLLGVVPYEGEYGVWHEPPPIVIPHGSRIRDGQRLLVSYYHTVTIHDGQVVSCLVAPEIYTHLARSIRDIETHLKPAFYFMSHDEIRLADQCAACKATGKTAGELLAANVARCVQIIREANPSAEIIVWSDMFDPHHNAVERYYLAGSTFAESWRGLNPAVTIANWNERKRGESLRFFADRSHRQLIACYYDHPDVEAEVARWKAAAAGIKGVDGWMYTTWRRNYRELERFAAAVLAD